MKFVVIWKEILGVYQIGLNEMAWINTIWKSENCRQFHSAETICDQVDKIEDFHLKFLPSVSFSVQKNLAPRDPLDCHTRKTKFYFPFKSKGIWLYWQFPLYLKRKFSWNSNRKLSGYHFLLILWVHLKKKKKKYKKYIAHQT